MQFWGKLVVLQVAVNFEKTVLNDNAVREKHLELTNLQNYSLSKRDALGSYKSDGESLFVSNQEGAKNYRIPSLLSEFALTKQLELGIQLEHRHALSDAKLKQTQILEYKF